MSGEKAKLIFTSPPYNMGAGMYEDYSDNMKSIEYINFNLDVVKLWQEFLRGYLFWNISYNRNTRWEFIEILYRVIKETGLAFLELIVWDKGHGLLVLSRDMLTRQYEDILFMGDEESIQRELELYYIGTIEKKAWFNKVTGKGITNYWRIDTNNTQLKSHLACFPVELPSKAIRLMPNINDIICEPFGGSGTTLIAAEQLGRRCYIMEFSPLYCDIIVSRYVGYIGDPHIICNEKKIVWEAPPKTPVK
jgi:DNA modification methylase